MKLLLSLIFLTLIPNVVCAADFSSPLVQGQVTVKAQAAITELSASDTVSLGAFVVDTGELLFCAAATPGSIVEGLTSVIVSSSEDIFIEFFAFADPDCSDSRVARSIASADRYRVVFGAPGQPILLELVGS